MGSGVEPTPQGSKFARQAAHLRQRHAAAGQQVLARSSLSRYVCIASRRSEAQALLDELWPRLHERRVYFAGRRGVPAHAVAPLDTARALREQWIVGIALAPLTCDHATGIPSHWSLNRQQPGPRSR